LGWRPLGQANFATINGLFQHSLMNLGVETTDEPLIVTLKRLFQHSLMNLGVETQQHGACPETSDPADGIQVAICFSIL